MSRRYLLLLAALLTGVFIYSQPTVALQAYKQPVMPGTVPVGVYKDAPPTGQISQRTSTNYYLYLIYPQSATIRPKLVWINRKPYKITLEPVDKTPVEHTNRNIPARPVTTVLVAKTPNKVVRLVPVSLADAAIPSATVKKLMETSELVVSYQWKGKTYHKAVKKIKELEPLMME
jgi:hypothetical protein